MQNWIGSYCKSTKLCSHQAGRDTSHRLIKYINVAVIEVCIMHSFSFITDKDHTNFYISPIILVQSWISQWNRFAAIQRSGGQNPFVCLYADVSLGDSNVTPNEHVSIL